MKIQNLKITKIISPKSKTKLSTQKFDVKLQISFASKPIHHKMILVGH